MALRNHWPSPPPGITHHDLKSMKSYRDKESDEIVVHFIAPIFDATKWTNTCNTQHALIHIHNPFHHIHGLLKQADCLVIRRTC